MGLPANWQSALHKLAFDVRDGLAKAAIGDRAALALEHLTGDRLAISFRSVPPVRAKAAVA